MSPSIALIYVENIRKALAALDPANAATYAANAAAYAGADQGAVDAPLRKERAGHPARRPVAGW